MCLLFFRRDIYERPSTLDGQRRTPTKGRIQNTPKKGKGSEDPDECGQSMNRRETMQPSARIRKASLTLTYDPLPPVMFLRGKPGAREANPFRDRL